MQSTEKYQIEGGKLQEHVIFKVTLLDEHVTTMSRIKSEPVHPTGPLQISVIQFCNALPYHILFDKNLIIKQCGNMIQELMHVCVDPGVKVSAVFEIKHPFMDFTIENIRTFINAVFMLSIHKSIKGGRELVLKGQLCFIFFQLYWEPIRQFRNIPANHKYATLFYGMVR